MVRTAKALSLMLMVVLLCSLCSPVCQAWSVWPFGDSKAEQTQAEAAGREARQKGPGVNMGQPHGGNQAFLQQSWGDGGFEETGAQKPEFAVPRPMVPQKAPPKSWLGSLFKPKDPPPPKDVAVFIGQKRPTVP